MYFFYYLQNEIRHIIIKFIELFAKIYISCLTLTCLTTQKGCIEKQVFINIVYMSPCPNARLSQSSSFMRWLGVLYFPNVLLFQLSPVVLM